MGKEYYFICTECKVSTCLGKIIDDYFTACAPVEFVNEHQSHNVVFVNEHDERLEGAQRTNDTKKMP